MSKYDQPSNASTIIAALCVFCFMASCAYLSIVSMNKRSDRYRSCIVASTNVTLIPASPNSITILRNGKEERCYVYKEPKGIENGKLSNK